MTTTDNVHVGCSFLSCAVFSLGGFAVLAAGIWFIGLLWHSTVGG